MQDLEAVSESPRLEGKAQCRPLPATAVSQHSLKENGYEPPPPLGLEGKSKAEG